MKIKIIATIGPSTRNSLTLKKLVGNGVDIGRINMKHADFNEAQKNSELLSKLKCKVLIDIEHVRDLKLIKDLKFDYLALSFTETIKQIKMVREFFSPKKVFIISKIETRKGLRNINNIIDASDGVMVARGDLGKCLPLAKLPLFQKSIIKKCNQKKKFVITATEMLLSMVNSKVPGRAEVSDVANAVLDGSKALMLSEETAIGKYPVEAVSMMREIIKETLKSGLYRNGK